MKKSHLWWGALLTLTSCAPGLQLQTEDPRIQVCQDVQEAQVASWFEAWNASLATGDPAKVAALYQPGAELFATVSNKPRNTPALIRDYFTDFLQKSPQGLIEQRTIRLGCNMAVDSGVYTFTFNKDGSRVTARYTYVYEYRSGRWGIAVHHSSAMPQNLSTEPWR